MARLAYYHRADRAVVLVRTELDVLHVPEERRHVVPAPARGEGPDSAAECLPWRGRVVLGGVGAGEPQRRPRGGELGPSVGVAGLQEEDPRVGIFAQAGGEARTDIDDAGIARLIMGAAAMNFASEEQRQRMLDVLFDGLRAR